MLDKICSATLCTYPGGGCWGVRTQRFELGNFDRVQILPSETLSEAEFEERTADAGANGVEFIQRLRSIPGIGSYIMLNRNGFTFSMNKHREASDEEIRNLHQQVRKAFCEVYELAEMRYS